MAVQTDGSPPAFSAETVGHAFVSQFYFVMHSQPDVAHRFFQDSSTMTRPGSNGSLETVTSMDGIKQLILSLDCQDCKAEILTADAQASYGNGVTVLVTGCLTGKDNVRRKFTELFFLAPQESGGYFVYNNAFRFIDEETLPVVESAEEKDVDESEPAASVIPIEEIPDATITHTPAVDEKIEDISISKDEHKATVKENVVPQASSDSSHTVQPVSEPLSNGHVDAGSSKMSYVQKLLHNASEGRSMVLSNNLTTAAKMATKSAMKKPVQQTRDAATPAVQQMPATSALSAASGTVASAANGSKAINGSNGHVVHQAEGKGYSIYIGGLPYNASEEQVELEFKKFGHIRPGGIQVRSNKGYCFGFVEYEDASAQQKALQVGKVSIGGKEVTVEEKRTGTKVVNGVNVYPSGRSGAYRNDGFRGRNNYSNGGGRAHGRNDYGKLNGADYGNQRNGDDYGYKRSREDFGRKRNGEFSSRGSSRNNGDGYVYQNGNGSGRGARQGAPSK